MDNQKHQTARILPKQLSTFADNSAESIANLFISLKFTPNVISFIALTLGFGAGILFAMAQPLWAGVVIILCGFFDVLDGQVAAKTNKKSLFGAIFDSTLDRYSEFFIYLGIAYYFRDHWALWLCFFTFFGSYMVSYTRARAEGLGIDCQIGIMQRAERLGLLAIGSLFGSAFGVFDAVMIAVLIAIAVISNITTLQRIYHVKKKEKLTKTSS
ncbi:MAG: CDP-alcohol phosphatidyltransferase family protein [Candidatus Aminicenantes bacterium]|nr:MAG: CDP-alcohol phosphatidyltransferase family protein [Candidatus Aminicenantes bacterium]